MGKKLIIWLLWNSVRLIKGNWVKLCGKRASGLISVENILCQIPWGSRSGQLVLSKNDEVFMIGGEASGDQNYLQSGLLNDVWQTDYQSGSSPWDVVQSSRRIESQVERNRPKFKSRLSWKNVLRSYDFFSQANESEIINQTESSALRHFAPRRDHGGVVFQDKIFVLGGLAIADHSLGSSFYYDTALRSDVWSSEDGQDWEMVSPGCRVGESLLEEGVRGSQCSDREDCFGESECVDGRCECRYWTPRMKHSVNVINETLYVSGGITAIDPEFCGNEVCNRNNFKLAKDIWRSFDGKHWTKVSNASLNALNHQVESLDGQLIEINDIKATLPEVNVFNDSSLVNESFIYHRNWDKNHPDRSFSMESTGEIIKECPVVDRDGLPEEGFRFLKVLNGENTAQLRISTADNISEVKWEAREKQNLLLSSPICRIDLSLPTFSEDAFISVGIRTVRDLIFAQKEQIVALRIAFNEIPDALEVCVYRSMVDAFLNKCYDYEPFPIGMENDTLSQAIYSLGQANAYLEEDLSTRFPTPSSDINSIRERQRISLDALFLDETNSTVAGLYKSSSNIDIEDWQTDLEELGRRLSFDEDQVHELRLKHDSYGDTGCSQGTYVEDFVSELGEEEKLLRDQRVAEGKFDDIVCLQKYSFAHFTLLNHGCSILAFGGGDSNDIYFFDDDPPNTVINLSPMDSSSETEFEFICDEQTCIFEYKLEALEEGLTRTISDWNFSTGFLDLETILQDESSGTLRFTVRAIDAAGNKDLNLETGRNVYEWHYSTPVSGLLVLSILASIIVVIVGITYRRQQQQTRSENQRYALKRMERKKKNLEKAKIKKSPARVQNTAAISKKAKQIRAKVERGVPGLSKLVTSPKSPQSNASKVSPTGEATTIVNFDIPKKRK